MFVMWIFKNTFKHKTDLKLVLQRLTYPHLKTWSESRFWIAGYYISHYGLITAGESWEKLNFMQMYSDAMRALTRPEPIMLILIPTETEAVVYHSAPLEQGGSFPAQIQDQSVLSTYCTWRTNKGNEHLPRVWYGGSVWKQLSSPQYGNYMLSATYPQSHSFMRGQGLPTTLYQYVWTQRYTQFCSSDLLSLLLPKGFWQIRLLCSEPDLRISQRNGSNKDTAAKMLSYWAWLCVWAVCVSSVCEVRACLLSALLLVWHCCLLVRNVFNRATIPSNLTEDKKERKSANVLTLRVCVSVCVCKGTHKHPFALICCVCVPFYLRVCSPVTVAIHQKEMSSWGWVRQRDWWVYGFAACFKSKVNPGLSHWRV